MPGPDVHATGKAVLAIHDQDLAMVTQVHGEARRKQPGRGYPGSE
jgi:hypothetical protein